MFDVVFVQRGPYVIYNTLEGMLMDYHLFSRVKNKIREFFLKESGAVAIIAGLAFLVLIGFAALTIDVGTWYSERRQLQFAADAGAVGGAIALKKTGSSTINTYATKDIQLNGCTSANNCTIVAINHPPTSGTSAGNTAAVEVILSKPADTFLSQAFLSSAPTLQVRSVAGNQVTNNCLISLAPYGVGVNVKGGGSLTSPQCGIYANSSASDAVNVTGGGVITTSQISVVGGTNTAGGGTIKTTNGISTGVSPLSDPLSSVSIPSFSGCTQRNLQVNNTTMTINPGVYCGGIKLVSSAKLTMNPGIYFIDKGDFVASAQSILNASGVTVIMTSSTGSNYGNVTINGGATVTMSPPSTGTTAGILFYGDRKSSGINEKFAGGASQVLSGILYFPTNNLDYRGQTTATGNPCFQIIAQNITLTGGSVFGNGCPTTSSAGNTQLLE